MKTSLLSLIILCVLAEAAVAGEPITLKLWPDGPPTAMVPKSDATVKTIQSYGGPRPDRVTDVTEPTIFVFRPDKPNGTSVIVAPGGGYMFLSYAHDFPRQYSLHLTRLSAIKSHAERSFALRNRERLPPRSTLSL